MISSVLKRLMGNKSDKQTNDREVTVDLSRAIPGYKPPQRHADAPPQAARSEAELAANAAETEEATLVPRTPSFDPSAPPEERAEAAIEALADKHDAWAQTDLARLNEAWEAVRQNADLQGHLQDVSRAAHNLKGMATTYGHPAISRLASSLCKLLDSQNANSQHALINLHIEACRAAYLEGSSTEGGDMVAQSVCVALETQVKRTLEA